MIKKAQESDIKALAQLAVIMWDTHNKKELEQEFFNIMQTEKSKFF